MFKILLKGNLSIKPAQNVRVSKMEITWVLGIAIQMLMQIVVSIRYYAPQIISSFFVDSFPKLCVNCGRLSRENRMESVANYLQIYFFFQVDVIESSDPV